MTRLLNTYSFLFCILMAFAGCSGEEGLIDQPSPGETADPKKLTQRAIDKQNIGALEEAIEILKTALQIEPGFVRGYYRMGLVYEEWDKKKKAVEAYKKALKLDPQNVEARLGLGSVYAKLKRNELAIEEYKKVAAMKPANLEIPFKIALEYWYIQRIPEAAEYYNKVLAIDSGHLQARLNLGSVYERMKEWQKALEQIEIVLKLARETGDSQAVAIAEGKIPFLKGRMNMTAKDLNRKSIPPFD